MGHNTVSWDEQPQDTLNTIPPKTSLYEAANIVPFSHSFELLVNLTLKISAPIKSRRWERNALSDPHKVNTVRGPKQGRGDRVGGWNS